MYMFTISFCEAILIHTFGQNDFLPVGYSRIVEAGQKIESILVL